MAKISSSTFKMFLVSGVSLLGAKPKAITDKTVNAIQNDTHGLGDEWAEHSGTGMMRGELTQSGAFFDTVAAGFHEAFKAVTNVVRTVVYAAQGNTIGAPFVGWEGAYIGSYDGISNVGKLTEANATYAVTGRVDRGVILQDWSAETIDWTSAGVDNGASSANGGAGYLAVSAQDAGITGFIGKIQHSDDNGSVDPYTDLITFTNVTGAPASERKTVSSTVKRWTRFDGNLTGTGSMTVFAGFARNA